MKKTTTTSVFDRPLCLLSGFLLASSFVTTLSFAQEATAPEVGQFQVNLYTTGDQLLPKLGVDAVGGFVAIWGSEFSDNGDDSEYGIQGLRFDSEGSPIGAQFLVNSYTTGYQWRTDVAMNSSGEFVVAWDSVEDTHDSSPYSVQARRYGSHGQPLGDQFLVNITTAGIQFRPAVAIGEDGSFVIVWSEYRSLFDDSSYAIVGRRFSADGTAISGEFGVNSYTTGAQQEPDVVMDTDGSFVIVWQSLGADSGDDDSYSIQGQRFASDGSAIGGQFQVNSYTTYGQRLPAIDIAPDGDFLVVWQGDAWEQDLSGTAIQARLFSSDGSAHGDQFQVNTYTTSFQREPAVASLDDGDWVITWHSEASENDAVGDSVQGQRFSQSGVPIDGQFEVESATEGNQERSSVAALPGGEFLVAWDSASSVGDDDSGSSIQARRFLDVVLLVDDFESGDTAAWTTASP